MSLAANARTSRASAVLASEIEAISRNASAKREKAMEAGEYLPSDSQELFDGRIVNTEDGTSPTVWSKDYCGLLASYWIVGTLQGITGVLFPLVIYVNNKEPAFYTASAQLITIFWSYKIFYGFITDFIPLLGYRRKAYMLGGHGLAILIGFVMVFVCNDLAIEGVLALLTLQNFFSVFADVASDGFTVQIAHRESNDTRGKTQTYAYASRFVANCIGNIMSGFLLNGPSYGGSFDFELNVKWVFLIYACTAAIAYPLVIFCLKEPRNEDIGTSKSIGAHLNACKEMLLSRPIYQLIFFTIINQTLAGLVNSTNSNYSSLVLGVTPLQNNLNVVLQYVLVISGMMVIKTWFLNFSWRKMFIFSLTVQVILTNLIYLFVWDVSHDAWLYTFLSATNQFAYGMNFIIGSFFVVEIALPGQEAITYSILSTVHNLAIPLTTVISNQLLTAFDYLDNASIKADTTDFRTNWSYLQLVITILNMCSLFALFLFPTQKAHAQALMKKPSNRAIGWTIFALGVLLLLYTTVTIVLTIMPSTQCLEIAGGSGC